MQEQTITALRESLAAAGLPFVQDEPLAGHTTFKIGGPAAFWCTPHNAEELRSTLALCRENGARVYLLGNGSNTLFDDAGFDGAVIDMRGVAEMEHSDADNDVVRITAGAGQTLGRLCSKAQALGLTGLEFACGIPGTVGGALLVVAGLVGLGMAFFLGNMGLQYGASRLPTSTTSIVMLTEVVFASVSSIALGAATLSLRTLVGASLILLASILAARGPAEYGANRPWPQDWQPWAACRPAPPHGSCVPRAGPATTRWCSG